jgi:phage terminase Nu1 subunit (DNA packaging protein)
MSKLVSKKELSVLLGKSERTLSEWQKQGLPVVKATAKGLANEYDTAQVINWLLSRYDPGSNQGSESGNFEEERTRLTKAQADKIELEVKVMQGKLLPAEEIESVWSDQVIRMRSKLLAMPVKLSVLLIGKDKQADIEQILRKEIHEALTELSAIDIDEPAELDIKQLVTEA